MPNKPRITEDWLAVLTGLLLFLLSLGLFFGADVLGWAITTSVWTDVSKALAPASKAWAGVNPLVSLVATWAFLTVLLGIVFAGLHIREWMGMIHEGVTLSANPWGSKQFGAVFFSITGLHLTHVIGGVIALTVVALGYKRGRYKSADVEVWGLYWHFVDLVWMFVVPFVYLLNVQK